jgi:hypothetical protein
MASNKIVPNLVDLDVNTLSNTNKIIDTRQTMSGITPNTPAKNTSSGRSRIEALSNSITASDAAFHDKNEYGSVYAYDNSPSGPTFKARYKAYGQDTYNKIGFDPHIDNEAVYNQQTNTFDDMKRWAVNAALPMVGLGFMSPINSYASALGSGNLGASTQEAKDYEYYNALGYSSKGGLGGFTTNLFNSVSYSAGILLEGVAEGMMIGAAVGAVGGGGAGAAPGSIIGGAVEGIKAFGKIPSALYQSVKNIGKINTAISELKNINNAKNFFVSAAKGTAKFINPLENTYDALKTLNQVDDIGRLAKTARTAGAFWHDIMGINMALSEGRLEGGFSEQNIYNKLYNDHYSKFGQAPSAEEQKKMMMQAKKAGFANTMWNSGLVFYSNKIAFPSITRAGFLKGVPRFNFGKVVGEVGKEFQIVFNPADDVAKSYYSKEAISLKNSLKGLKDPKKLGSLSYNYFKKNIVEGIQEISQEALSSATEKYYTDTYNNPAAKGFMYGFGALLDGFGKQMNAQGAEVFGSGFLMGSLLEGPSKMFKFGTKNFSRLFKDKAVYDQYVKEKEAQADNIVNSLNNMHKNAKHFFDPRMSNYATQMLVAKAVDNPEGLTTKEAKDLEFQGFQSSVLTALRTGTFDMFIKNLGEYKSLTPEELEEAWSLEPGQGQKALQNIDKAINSAKVTEARFNYARDKFKSFIDLNNYKEGSPEYRVADIYNQAYLESINSFVFLQDTFDNGINRLEKLYGTANKIKSLTSSPFTNFSILSDANKLSAQISYLEEEIDSLASLNDPKLREEIVRKRTLLNALNTFHTSQENITGRNTILEILNNLGDSEKDADPRLFDYKNSFEKLIEAIAINNKQDGAFEDIDQIKAKLRAEIDNNGGMDSLFNSMFDIHLLRHENSSIAKYINMLADPQGFYDHLNNNFAWMKNLYNNRKEYYKEIVNKEISDVEKNEVLNTLASKGIFVDLDEFAEWSNNPEYIPSYFIDTTKEMIINQDSVLYEDYAYLFQRAAELIKKKAAGNPATDQKKYEDRLDELRGEKNNELNKSNEDFEQAFKDETGIDLQNAYAKNQEAYDKNNQLEEDKKVATEKINKLQSLLEAVGKDPVDANEIVKLADELLTSEELVLTDEEIVQDVLDAIMDRPFKKADDATLFKASDVIYVLTEKAPLLLAQKIEEQNNILKQNPVDIIDVENTKSYKVNQERIESINKRYDKFEAELEEEFKDIQGALPDAFTTQMGYDNYPQDLQNLVNESFNAFLLENETDPVAFQETEPVKYSDQRQNWLESSDGNKLLNEYNKKVKEEGAARAKALTEPPVLTSRIGKNLKIDPSIPISTLNIVIDKFENALKTKIYTVYKNGIVDKEVKLTEQDLKEIGEDVDKLKTFLKYKQGISKPVNVVEEVFSNFKKNVQARQDELEDVFDEDGNKIGRKFAGDPDTKLTTRVTTISDGIASKLSDEEKPGYSEKYVDQIVNAFFSEYNTAVKKGDPEAFNKAWAVFTELARNSNKQLNTPEKKARIRESLEKNTTEENLRKLIGKEAFSNNAQAGTNLDAAVRKFFTIDAVTGDWISFNYSDTIEVDGKDVKISDTMSENAFNQMFGVTGVVTRFRTSLKEQNYVPLTNNVKLFDKNLLENGVSGETDMVLINGKGEIMIVDIKTSTSWNGFNKPTSWKNIAYRAQLSIYRNLYHNMTGVTPKIALFPMRISLKSATAYVTDVTVGGEKTKSTPLEPLVPNTAKLFNTLELEYLPDVENEGITLSTPEVLVATETPVEETPKVEKSSQITASDTSKILLKDNLGKQVVYNGKLGTLVLQEDGSYGVEVDLSLEQSLSNDVLSTLEIDLEFEKGEFGNPERAKEIEKQIEDLQKTQKGKETYPILSQNKNISDGNVELTSAGLALITPIENIGQISIINGTVIDAKFENNNEDVAIVNGVRYNVGRNTLGEITQLVYYKNDKRREELDKLIIAFTNKINSERQKMKSAEAEIKTLSQELVNLEKQKRSSDTAFTYTSKKIKSIKQKINSLSQAAFIRRIGKAQDKIKEFQDELSRLSTDDKVFVLGGNTNDVIFALNRLPNQFQKGKTTKTGLDTEKELKQIAALSDASPTVEKEIDSIIDKNFPEELNVLFAKGISEFKGKGKELAKIKNWISEKINALLEYQNMLMLENNVLGFDAVDRQINALNELTNQLNLINLTAKNRIAKEQLYEQELNKIFGPESEEEIQSSTSVSEIQSPTGGQTETIPGETSTGQTQEISNAELTKIVRSSAEELEALVSDEFVTNKAVEAFAEITDIQALKIKKNELLRNKNSNNLYAAEIETAFNNRAFELREKVSIDSLKVGDILQDIGNFTNQDSPVQVVEVNKNSVILKYGEVTQEVTEEMLVNNFVKPTNETEMPEIVKPSQETVDASEQTKTDATENLSNKEFLNRNEKEADDTSEDDLFKNLEDNSKTC